MLRVRRRPGSGPSTVAAVTTALVVSAMLLTIGYLIRQRNNTDPELTHERMLLEREQLLQQVSTWNARAAAMGHADLAKLNVATAAEIKPTETKTIVATQAAASEDAPREARFRMRPAAEIEKEAPELAAALKKYAKNNEIMLTLANGIMICKNTTICWWNGGNILESFITILHRNNITNHLIGVLDDETERYLTGRPNVNWMRINIKIPESQGNTHPANRVSTIKYTLLKYVIQLGYNTLVTDMDLVYIKNPFDHLHRDADIEIQTDGFDDMSYGIIDSVHDPVMGWGAGGLYMKTFTTNVGCVWVKANQRSYTLMVQVSDHLSQHQGWDQQVFNQYLMQPSHGDFTNSYAHLRIMDYMKFVNSKIFFKSRRDHFIPGATSKAETPVMVHFNYHPDKHKRMLCIMDRYFYGKVDACDKMPRGSDPNS